MFRNVRRQYWYASNVRINRRVKFNTYICLRSESSSILHYQGLVIKPPFIKSRAKREKIIGENKISGEARGKFWRKISLAREKFGVF